jgi:hypothetical protein
VGSTFHLLCSIQSIKRPGSVESSHQPLSIWLALDVIFIHFPWTTVWTGLVSYLSGQGLYLAVYPPVAPSVSLVITATELIKWKWETVASRFE